MENHNSRKQTKAGRFYDIPGVGLLPSVTTILQVINKPALVNWAAKVEREMVVEVSAGLYADAMEAPVRMSKTAWITSIEDRLGKTKAARKLLAKAGEIGTEAHALIEWTLKGKLFEKVGPQPKVSDKAQWSFMAWEDWERSVNLKPLRIEQVVYSEKYGFAGTLDLVAEVNGRVTVLDWKTGKAVYAESHLQNAAYRYALREMGHGNAVDGLILRLPKVDTDPDFEAVPALPEAECLEAFLHFLEGWKWTQKMEEMREQALEEVSK